MKGQRPAAVDNRIKWTTLYVLFADGVPIAASHSENDEPTTKADFLAGVDGIPENVEITLKPIWKCTKDELDLLKLTFEIKQGTFAMDQISAMVRAGRSGLVHPAAGGNLPPPPGAGR